MSERTKEELDIDTFFKEVIRRIEEGMKHRDAIELTAVIMGGAITPLVSQAINKYQEAIHVNTELSKQERVDEYALASMGKLWHGEDFEESAEEMTCTTEEIFVDSLYFILKYVKKEEENALEEALKANDKVSGDKTSRAKIIRMVLSV